MKQWKVRHKVQSVWLGRTPETCFWSLPEFLWHQYKCSRTWITHHRRWRQCFPRRAEHAVSRYISCVGWRHAVGFWTFGGFWRHASLLFLLEKRCSHCSCLCRTHNGLIRTGPSILNPSLRWVSVTFKPLQPHTVRSGRLMWELWQSHEWNYRGVKPPGWQAWRVAGRLKYLDDLFKLFQRWKPSRIFYLLSMWGELEGIGSQLARHRQWTKPAPVKFLCHSHELLNSQLKLII